MLRDCSNDEAIQLLDKAGQNVQLLVCRSVIAILSNSPSFVDGKCSDATIIIFSNIILLDSTPPRSSSHTSVTTGYHVR